jgi:hypothetical protein
MYCSSCPSPERLAVLKERKMKVTEKTQKERRETIKNSDARRAGGVQGERNKLTSK